MRLDVRRGRSQKQKQDRHLICPFGSQGSAPLRCKRESCARVCKIKGMLFDGWTIAQPDGRTAPGTARVAACVAIASPNVSLILGRLYHERFDSVIC